MRKYTLILLTIAVTLAGIPALIFFQNRLADTVVENKLQTADFAEDGGAPPEVAISTIFLGGFRNILINFLWLRMTNLQTQGKYYEMVQLANWILSVQPDNSQVAQFLGWNMAYNISVVHPERDTRWRWIRSGIRTLQKAITLNPNEIMLYRELGWIFQHKVGDELDDHHLYYKYLLAKELYTLYGNRLEPDWDALAKAPADKDAFLKRFPENAPVWRIAGKTFDDMLKSYIETGTLPEQAMGSLKGEDPAVFRAGMARLALKKQFDIDPEIVQEVDATYGKLCWLLPESFAIYWGHQGIKASRGEDEIECRRIVAQSLKISFSMGNILFLNGEPEEYYLRTPNMNVFDSATKTFTDMYEELQAEGAVQQNIAYGVFLQECLITYYLHGDYAGAQKCYKLLQELEFENAQHMSLQRFLDQRMRFLIDHGSYNQIHSILVTLVLRAVYAYANGDRETAAYQLELAAHIHKVYARRNKDIAFKDRLKQVSLRQIKETIVAHLRQKKPELASWLESALEAMN